MPKAVFNGEIVAQSDACVAVEGNQYFPRDSVNPQYLRPSDHHSHCGWKGTASYYDVVVDSEVAGNGAWYYPEPKEGAEQVAGRIAFWKGVKVEA